MVVGLLVYITLKSSDQLQQLTDDLAALYKYTRATEPQTLTYEVHVSNENSKQVVLIERYTTADALDNVHSQSPVFLAFKAKLATVDYVEAIRVERTTEANAEQLGATAGADGVLVFCGSRSGAKASYAEAGKAMGAEIAKRGLFLVYGAGTVGIMGAVVNGFREVAPDGVVKAVIPRALTPKEVCGQTIGDVILTDTMGERKTVLFSYAKRVIALPGGLGTFDELLEALTLQQLSAIKVKIGVLNIDGFFDPFFVLVEHMIKEGFVEESARGYFVSATTPADLLNLMDSSPPAVGYNLKW